MDYSSFQGLHDMLKDGIIEYIQGNESSPNNSGNKSFFIQHGDISTEIHLACALRYFAGRSYLDITMSHAIGVTDFYLSIWAIVDAMNRCPLLQFQFPTTISECQTISTEFSSRSKAGFNNCIGCIDGLLIWLEKPSQKQCEQVGVDSGKFYCGFRVNLGSIFKEFLMLDDDLHIFPYNIPLLHLIIYHLQCHLYMVISLMKIPVFQVVIVYMVIMPMSTTHTWQFHIPVLPLDQKMPTITSILR